MPEYGVSGRCPLAALVELERMDRLYDIMRNIILGDGVLIPYPEKYWTAEVFLDGCDKPGSAYLFSVGMRE